MANTGMQEARKAAVTGSSFYNATMAKTKIQEQNQQEELQKQLAKIFKEDSDDKTNNQKQTIEVSDQNNKYRLPMDSEVEEISDFNIA